MSLWQIEIRNHHNSNDYKILYIDNEDDANVIEDFLTQNYLSAHQNKIHTIDLDKDMLDYLKTVYGSMKDYYVVSTTKNQFEEKIPRKAICETCGYECNTNFCGNCGSRM